MDIGGGRLDSPFNLFHLGILSGDYHCHAVHDTMLVDAESDLAWAPRIESQRCSKLDNPKQENKLAQNKTWIEKLYAYEGSIKRNRGKENWTGG